MLRFLPLIFLAAPAFAGGTATLNLYRPAADALFIRSPDITINETKVCVLGEDEMASIEVPAGPLIVDASSWDAESYMKLDAKAGRTYELRMSGEKLAFDAPAPEAADIRGNENGKDWFYLELVRESTATREREKMDKVECETKA